MSDPFGIYGLFGFQVEGPEQKKPSSEDKKDTEDSSPTSTKPQDQGKWSSILPGSSIVGQLGDWLASERDAGKSGDSTWTSILGTLAGPAGVGIKSAGAMFSLENASKRIKDLQPSPEQQKAMEALKTKSDQVFGKGDKDGKVSPGDIADIAASLSSNDPKIKAAAKEVRSTIEREIREKANQQFQALLKRARPLAREIMKSEGPERMEASIRKTLANLEPHMAAMESSFATARAVEELKKKFQAEGLLDTSPEALAKMTPEQRAVWNLSEEKIKQNIAHSLESTAQSGFKSKGKIGLFALLRAERKGSKAGVLTEDVQQMLSANHTGINKLASDPAHARKISLADLEGLKDNHKVVQDYLDKVASTLGMRYRIPVEALKDIELPKLDPNNIDYKKAFELVQKLTRIAEQHKQRLYASATDNPAVKDSRAKINPDLSWDNYANHRS